VSSNAYDFKISTLCNGENGGCGCVEVATNLASAETGGTVGLRDSKSGVTVVFTPHEWSGFIAGVKAGEFDLTT
jgi:ABC-type amino acid transport substrate-binding protein